MEANLKFLKAATDFSAITEKTFEFNFNEFRGGSFTRTMPKKVHAYGVEWICELVWIDMGWGDYKFAYYSEKDPILPEKILIETEHSDMPGWCDTVETVRFYGKQIFTQSDDWGRHSLIWLKGFEEELEQCSSEREVLKKIKTIQNREYYQRRKKELAGAGLSKEQIKKFFNCKNANWKYEALLLKVNLINNTAYPKKLFKELSEAQSNRQFDRRARAWGLKALCEYSHPRKTNYAKLIYNLK